MPAEVGAAEAARAPVHLFTKHLGEPSKNLGRLLLGEGILAVAELAAALPPSCRCWCWWEMIPEICHYQRAASGARRRRAMKAGALRSAAVESLRGFKGVGGVLIACFLTDLWGLGRVLRLAAWPS